MISSKNLVLLLPTAHQTATENWNYWFKTPKNYKFHEVLTIKSKGFPAENFSLNHVEHNVATLTEAQTSNKA